jgi:hypothetical protein
MKAIFLLALRVVGLGILVLGAGCAIFDDAHEDHWRKLVVKDLVRRADLPMDVDRRCVDAQPGADSDEVAVVQYRVGKSLYSHAFVTRPEDQVHVSERVAVNPRLCALRFASPG